MLEVQSKDAFQGFLRKGCECRSGPRGGSDVENKQQVLSGLLAGRWCGGSRKYVVRAMLSTKHFGKLGRMWWYKQLLIFWFAVGLFSSLFLYHHFDVSNSQRRRETLSSMCDERARMLQDQFVASMNHVRALTALVTTFHLEKQPSALDQKTFATYAARTACERPLMSGVAYAQKVLHEEREKFEKEQGWSIRKMHSRDWQPVEDEYAPATLTQETVGYLTSLDLMSGQEDRENILRARASGKGALTSPFRLLTNHLGIVFTFAVYTEDLPPDATPEHRIAHCAGYLGGAFDVESLVENLLRQLAGSATIVVNVYDITNNSYPLVMYGSSADNEMHHVSSLDFGDPMRRHEMRCRFVDPQPVAWTAIWSSLGLFVIFMLLGQIGCAAVRRISQVEKEVKKMEELKLRAESADVAKSQFLATVSHEIRTPMNGVLGMLQMLMDTTLDPTQMDYARTAQASGQALITLINEVLDQAKIESGRLELEAVPFDLCSVLDDVVSLFSSKSRDKHIELAVFVSDRVPRMLIGDPGRFRQIITNLVGNSIKFTEEGHIFLCVHLAGDMDMVTEASKHKSSSSVSTCFNSLSGFEAADGRNCWTTFSLLLAKEDASKACKEAREVQACGGSSDKVLLSVSVEDTGVGIPLHAQDRVFTPFMQADSSTSRTYGGTGIGLSISRCLVELMAGEMSFISQPGVGTTFTFTAALRRASAEENRPPQSPPLKLKGMSALVVDGRPVRAHVTQQHLRRLGLLVEMVFDVPSAKLFLPQQNDVLSTADYRPRSRFDVVLVDKDSFGPGTGITLPKRIPLSNLRFSKMPVYVLVATALTDEEIQHARQAGFQDSVVRKPLRASMLATSLEQALGLSSKGGGGRELSETGQALEKLLSGKCILVVDDNIVNRRVAAGTLKKYGAVVECAERGKAAITLLQPPHHFDACFMDVQMPEMDGFEATRHIRKAELGAMQACTAGTNGETKWKDRNCHIPILAMTADVIQATHEECLRSGMDGYVAKPFDEDQLCKALVSVL